MTEEAPAAPALRNTREQRSWYWYDWANSAYVTTTATVLYSPYLSDVATRAACNGSSDPCGRNLQILGMGVDPGSLFFYLVTISTLVSAVLLIYVGAIADRSHNPARLLAWTAWIGAGAASAMFLVSGTNWQLGSLLLVIASLCLGASMVIYDSLLCRIATPDERDAVSSRGWALGYAGGGLLLALNLGLLLLGPKHLGMSTELVVRICLLSAGLWWGLFTIIPFLGLRHIRGALANEPRPEAGVVGGSFAQLRDTFRDLGKYPQTMLFLVAYLFYNDGVQTVINASSIFGIKELGFAQETILIAFLVVQFVAFFGARGFGAIAARIGAWRSVRWSLLLWGVVVTVGFFLPKNQFVPFLAMSILIGLTLGGTQALSRSMYSQLIPAGREAEYFSLYQAMERGTSWFGTLLFGIVHQATHSYRAAVLALVVFFVIGGLLLSRVRMLEGIKAAGNVPPLVV